MEGLMTTYLTILWITMHGGPIEGSSYGIPFLTEAACKAAMKSVGDTLDYDYSMECASLPVEVEMEP
jgi:hypothetical protein